MYPFSFDLDPLSRHTIWALVIGGLVYWLQTSAVNQSMMQRYLSLPDLHSARRCVVSSAIDQICHLYYTSSLPFRALWLFVLGIFVVVFLCGYSGLLIYATYYKCDPLTTMVGNVHQTFCMMQ